MKHKVCSAVKFPLKWQVIPPSYADYKGWRVCKDKPVMACPHYFSAYKLALDALVDVTPEHINYVLCGVEAQNEQELGEFLTPRPRYRRKFCRVHIKERHYLHPFHNRTGLFSSIASYLSYAMLLDAEKIWSDNKPNDDLFNRISAAITGGNVAAIDTIRTEVGNLFFVMPNWEHIRFEQAYPALLSFAIEVMDIFTGSSGQMYRHLRTSHILLTVAHEKTYGKEYDDSGLERDLLENILPRF